MTGHDRIVLWNSAGFRAGTSSKRTATKFSFFDKQFPNANFAIGALVETHHKDENDFSDDLGQYDTTHYILHSPVSGETHSGIILIIRKDFAVVRQSVVIPGRLLNVRLQKGDQLFSLSIFYGYQWGVKKKDEIIDILNLFVDLHDPADRNIILGDFNFVDFDIDKGKNMDQRDKMISPIWSDVLARTGMVDPFRERWPRKKNFSFVSAQGKSRGDRVYISDDRASSVRNLKYINTPFAGAHKVLSFEILSDQDQGPSTWKMNSSVLDDPKFETEIELILIGLEEIDINPLDWWDLFIMVVQGTTIAYCRKKAKIKRCLKNHVVAKLEALESLDSRYMSQEQKADYTYYKGQMDAIHEEEIRGHEIRTRGQPKYEINEPNISLYSTFEKRYQSKNVIYELEDENGKVHSDNPTLLQITEKYYKKLFSKSKTCGKKQADLLKRVSKKLTNAQRANLDALLKLEELEKSVFSLSDGKSPGPDGVTVEFYKKFWYLIGPRYLAYINAAKLLGFHDHRNTSATTIIYKHKGETYQLDNYRPIALINVDLKILAKALSNRLRPVMPSIIHHSQTAVDKRRIDYTVHLLRDLIDLINKDDSEGALIFLDQEKAFDRVEHDFLFKTMEAFGIGPEFINWLRVIYANASTVIKVNGFYTLPILLTRGLRQGCPLSPSLYVLIIEIFALGLRRNPDIVGFLVGGERIVSTHYADDATIVITQNRCFKEVIKEIADYELASGAKVNYQKTKGLWLGKWKARQDTPLGITWTNKNVKTLGVYFGNDNPAVHTFADIFPKIRRSMNFWKSFKLCKFAKSRVIEIFHASRLWYASTFYPVNERARKDLQVAFLEYVNFPRSNTVSEREMKKLRLHGGIKLIDIQAKIETYRSRWLIDIASNPNLTSHRAVMTSLVGTQKGGLEGTDLIYVNKYYCKRLLKVPFSPFYKEAFAATAKLNLKKEITNLMNEKIFYNPMFLSANLKTIPIPSRCEREGIYTYGEIADEYTKQCNGEPHKAFVANVFPKIIHTDIVGRMHNTIFITELQALISFTAATCKDIYGEMVQLNYLDHHSIQKWEDKFPHNDITWSAVWKSLNNPVTSENTKTVVWEQIHLNDYCTYSYNKWHNKQDLCPLCLTTPTKFHLTLECETTNILWKELEPHLRKISRPLVTEIEKVFGIEGDSPNSILRNWITFILRECIVEQERLAFHNQKGKNNIHDIKRTFNNRVKTELYRKYLIYKNLGRLDYFKKIFAVNNYLITWENEWWQVLTIF